MKQTMFFKSEAEMLQYFGNDKSRIPSNILAIVGDEGSQVLFSTTNNIDGQTVDQGGYIDSPEEKAETAYCVAKSEAILEGEQTD